MRFHYQKPYLRNNPEFVFIHCQETGSVLLPFNTDAATLSPFCGFFGIDENAQLSEGGSGAAICLSSQDGVSIIEGKQIQSCFGSQATIGTCEPIEDAESKIPIDCPGLLFLCTITDYVAGSEGNVDFIASIDSQNCSVPCWSAEELEQFLST